MTSPRIYTAKRRSTNLLNHSNNILQAPNTHPSITVPSDYGSDIEIDTEVLADSREKEKRLKEKEKETEGDLDLGSDYGSDFDFEGEAILEDLLGEIEGGLGGDERGVAFLSNAAAGGRESLGTTATFSSCEEGVCGGEGEGETQEGGSGRVRREIVSKFCVLVLVVVGAFD